MNFIPEIVALYIIGCVIAIVGILLGLGGEKPQHTCSKNPVPTFPNFWRRSEK